MSKISERNGAEIPVYEWLAQMGWNCRTADELKGYSRPFNQPVIEKLLVEKVAALNSVGEAEAKAAVAILFNTFHQPVISTANEQFIDLLRDGVTLALAGKDRTLKLIDFDKVWDNDFIVTRQYIVQGTDMVRPDLVCLINGIPLVPFEAKQRAQQSSDWIKGVHDLHVYHSKVPRLLVCNLFGVACNGRIARYGIPGQTGNQFAEWKDMTVDLTAGNPLLLPTQTLCPVVADPKDGALQLNIPEYERMKRTIVGLMQPPRVLRLLRSYVVNEK